MFTPFQTVRAGRRRALRLLGGAAVLPLLACDGADRSAAAGPSAGACPLIPEETSGPFPGDGSNENDDGHLQNVLTLAGIVRSDIRPSFGAAGKRVAAGVPMTLSFELVGRACASLAGCAIYVWHCTADGLYSMYSEGASTENFLRGVQATGGDGKASFSTIVPGCYDGRMPHVHFEIYRSLAEATHADKALLTSQLTFPLSMLSDSYALPAYVGSADNLANTSYGEDDVFSDGIAQQMATVTGSVAGGFNASLRVAIDA